MSSGDLVLADGMRVLVEGHTLGTELRAEGGSSLVRRDLDSQVVWYPARSVEYIVLESVSAEGVTSATLQSGAIVLLGTATVEPTPGGNA